MTVRKFDSSFAVIPALFKAQSNFKPLQKSGINPAFGGRRYSTPKDIEDATSEALRAEDLILFDILTIAPDGMHILTTYLVHVESGESLYTSSPIPPDRQASADSGKAKRSNYVQDVGTAQTYFKRYHRLALLGITSGEVNEDGNSIAEEFTAKTVKASTPIKHPAVSDDILDDLF